MQSMPNYAQPVPAAQASVPERMAFLRKVYGLLSISVFMAAASSWMTLSDQGFLNFVWNSRLLFFVLTLASLFFVFWARKRESLGLIALFTFTIITGITTAPVLLVYTGATVTKAAVLTGIVFVSLSAYTIISKKDFSFLGGFLFAGLIILIVSGLFLMFFSSSLGSLIYSAAGVFIFSGFILYDTSNILRRYPTDEYISATLSLYLDILNLFLFLLQLLGLSRD